MPKFTYRAKRGPEDVVEGVLEAETQDAAVARLIDQGYIPMHIGPATAGHVRPATASGGRRGRASSREVTQLTRQLASLLKSHIPVLNALELIRTQGDRPGFRQLVGEIATSVREGQPLSEAFKRYPTLFPPLYCALIRAGEVGGQMDEMLGRLVEHREQQEQLRAKVQMAVVYPLFLLAGGVATIAVLLIVVMPKLALLLEGLQQTLPWPTRAVIAVSQVLSRSWWVVALALAIGWALVTRRLDRGRVLLDRAQLAIPFLRELTLKVEAARFCRTLGVLLQGGVSVLQAVSAAMQTVENQQVRARLAAAEGPLAAGTPLSRCLAGAPGFTPLILGMMKIGEESGNLPAHLMEVSATMESDVERALKVMTTLLEPGLIVVIGLIVGIIVAAMVLPVFEIGAGVQ